MYENYVVAGNDGQVKDDRLRALARRKPRGFQPQWLGVFGFSPCLSLLFKVLSCPMGIALAPVYYPWKRTWRGKPR